MSLTDPETPTPKTSQPRSLPGKITRAILWLGGSLLLLLVVLFAGFAWYSTTHDFQQRVGKQVVSILEDATGGKVDLASISFDLWHLAIEADGLVIHGLEGPNEAPYLAASKIQVRVKIISFFAHTAGTGVASHIGLNLLRVEDPHIHLIIDKDGKTNQPIPKPSPPSPEPLQDTLLDLRASTVELVNGVALVNDRAIPFSLAAQDLQATINYLAKTDRYGAVIDLRDLRTQMAKEPEAKSSLHVEAEIGRDAALLKAFDFHTGEHSELQASASVDHFANPQWKANVLGSLELKQIQILAGVDGLDEGSLELNVAGHNCFIAPAVAQKKPKLVERLRSRLEHNKAAAKTLPPDPECQKGYLLVGNAKLHDAGYVNEYVRVHGVNGGALLKITPSQLLFTALTGSLPTGGSVAGDLKIDNWLGEVPADTPSTSPTVQGATTTANKTAVAVTGTPTSTPVAPTAPQVGAAHAYLTVKVNQIPLRTIMAIAAPKNYGDLGFDTSINGPIKVEWGGPAANIADTVQVDADIALSPTGKGRGRGYPADIPVSGQVLAHYDGKREIVNVTRFAVTTPQSTLNADGVLGVSTGDPLTALNVDVSLRNLAEYDQLLRTLGVSSNGQAGAKAIPINLHGSAAFHGTARGALAKLDIKGHLEARDLEVLLGATPPPAPAPVKPGLLNVAATTSPAPAAASTPTNIHIDSLIADAEYTPSGLAVASSTITQGTAVLHVAGTFKPRTVYKKRVATYVWDDGTALDVKVQLGNANVVDLLTLAGQQKAVDLTGTITVDAHAAGTLKDLGGAGNMSLVNGVAYGEPYDSVNVDLNVKGKQIEATQLALKLHGMTIAGNGGFNYGSEVFHAHIQGDNLQLSKFVTVQKANTGADGLVSLLLDANGTAQRPGLKAHVQVANLIAQGKPLGDATLDAHSQGSLVSYTLRSNLVGATLNGDGQTDLTGNYQTQAKLSLAGLDIAKPLALFSPDGTKATSNIAGTITINGPAKTPMALAGQAIFTPVTVTSQGITLQSEGPLALSLRNGIATLDSVHITGQDTDLRASGTAQVFGGIDPKTRLASTGAGKLDVKANGSLNVALAHTLDPDLITSGKVTFSVGAQGVIASPTLTGKVDFDNVNAAMEGIANGLTNLHGTLVFNQNRLVVQNLTATTGGGTLNFGGFLSYRGGAFADLTATAEKVRIRLNGISGTANASLRLQGGASSALLSGNVLLTRFGVGADVDFAAFAGSGGVSAPPDPSAPTNNIRMDIHVTSSPQLDFQNSYAKLAGTVDLTVRGTVADPSILGRIQITDGSATFAGVNYQLERGNVYFSNPVRIDPTVDIDATARVETYDVTIGVHGTTTNLKTTYRSEPPLSEADIFSLLALGRTQEESQIASEQQVAAGTDPTTSALLGGALNATVGSRVSKLFGGSGGSVKIDPAFVGTLGNSSARITVQQQLSQQITLTFATNVNSSAQQLIQVAYQLSPNVSIVGARDETGVFSIVYKIRKRYR